MSAVSGEWQTTAASSGSHAESFPLFDWLRFVLASVVALTHAGLITWGPASALAVNVFFALSGWLIGSILLRTRPDDLPRFFFNRAARIWVPYLLAVAAIYLVGAARDSVNELYFEFLFYDLTFTHNYFIVKIPEIMSLMPLEGTGTHFWSISVEEQFYLAAPLVLVLFPWGRHLAIWVAIVMAMYLLETWYASISFGVLAAVARQRFGAWHSAAGARWPMAVAAAILMAGLVAYPDRFDAFVPPLSILVVLLTAVEGARGSVGSFLGGMSYPLYLNQWIGIFAANLLAREFELIPILAAPYAGYALAVVVAALAYVVVDLTIQRHRARLYTRRRGIAVAALAYLLIAAGFIGGIAWDLGGRFGFEA